jgi:hypothetical protein
MTCATEQLRWAREDLVTAARALKDAPDATAEALAVSAIQDAIARHDAAQGVILAEIQALGQAEYG